MKYYDYYKEKVNDIKSLKDAIELLGKNDFDEFVRFVRTNWFKQSLIKEEKDKKYTNWIKSINELDHNNFEKKYDYKTYKSKFVELLLDNINSDVELNLVMVCIIIYESSFYTRETIISKVIKDNGFSEECEDWAECEW